ncbi:MAG TPA: DUF2975 domain-containing protein [Intrasporangiaceae bacterium]|nr:DUF2975 domain-containing protein [Intrasporangiaceae bacterium]
MNRKVVIDILRVLLLSAIALILATQAFFLPWLSGELAQQFPAEAYVRWPILALSVTGLLCIQVVLGAIVLLLGRVRRGTFLGLGSLPILDGMIAAFAAAGAICLVTLVYVGQTVSGPPPFALMLLGGVGTGLTLALLTWVGRSILVDLVTGPSVSAVPLRPAPAHR